MTFPEFTTRRLRLTDITNGDVTSVFELFSNPSVVKFYDIAPLTDPAQAEKLIKLFKSRYESESGVRWAIRVNGSRELIGTCGFNSWNEKMRNATIGYDLKPDHWNQGIASEAVAGAIRTAFSGVLPCGPLHRIQADTIPGNIASKKLFLKLGFKEEGLRRQSAYIHGVVHDMKCFGLIKPEFNDVKAHGGS